MAAYPPTIGRRHSITPMNQRRVDVSDSGTPRLVDLIERTVYRIHVTHPFASATDCTTLQAFYNANRSNVNTIVLNGVTYQVVFASDYSLDQGNAAYRDVSVDLTGWIA